MNIIIPNDERTGYKKVKAGIHILETEQEINRTNKQENGKSSDSIARSSILQTLINSIVKGYTEEEAIEIAMKQPIIKELEYLGDLPKVFKNWISTKKVRAVIDKRIKAEKANIGFDQDER